MPVYQDHPVRVARLRRGLPMAQLAKQADVNRSTVTAIEEGRTRDPDQTTLRKIEPLLGYRAGTLLPAIVAWRKKAHTALSMRQRAVLTMNPTLVRQYPSFVAWRRDLGFYSPTALASAVHLSVRTVSEYEKGNRKKRGLPQALAMALVDTFDLSQPYLEELSELPPSGEVAS